MSDIKELNDRQSGMVNQQGDFNLWNNELVTFNGESNVVNLKNYANVSIMVSAYSDEANTTPNNVTLEFLASPDGEHFTFCSQITQNLPQGGDNEAHVFFTVGSKYMKLRRADADGEPELYIRAAVQSKP